jgi:hypothetical protein
MGRTCSFDLLPEEDVKSPALVASQCRVSKSNFAGFRVIVILWQYIGEIFEQKACLLRSFGQESPLRLVQSSFANRYLMKAMLAQA